MTVSQGFTERWQPATAAAGPPTHSSMDRSRNGSFEGANQADSSNNDRHDVERSSSRDQRGSGSEKRTRDSDRSHTSNKRRGYDTTSPSRHGRSSRPTSSHQSDTRRRDGKGGRHSSSESYYGRGRHDTHDEDYRGYDDDRRRRDDDVQDDWKCLECGLWNYPEDYQCHRCGERGPSPSRKKDDRKSHHRSEERRGSDSDGSVDEFGRAITRPTKANDPEWPPTFASNSAAYALDSRCGMFYEKDSDFYYDPKSKLYYGNKKNSYFRYDEKQTPKFVQVESPADALSPPGSTQDFALPVVQNLAPAPEAPPRMAIAINLKTKAMKDPKKRDKKKPSSATVTGSEDKAKSQTQQEARVHKAHAENIEKWTERGRELRDEIQEVANKAPTAKDTTSTAAGTSNEIARTAKGEPMCLLCKRKFPTVEKLRQHEQVSTLHKENLAKKEAADATTSEEQKANQQYRDRAQERRFMYGPETSSVSGLLRSEALEHQHPETATTNPEDNLGDSNIGNQMLQKLGWKAGSSFGRSNSGEGGQQQPQRSMEAALMQDWKRIESLASGNRKSVGSKGI